MDNVAAALSVEYEKVKENLKGVDENIIKLYGGRDPDEIRQQRRVSTQGRNVGARGGFANASAGRLFGEARRIINNPNREPVGGPGGVERGRGPVRRVSLAEGERLGGIRSRLGPKRRRTDSGDEEDLAPHKLMVQSAVVAPTVEVPKREDSVAMKTDKKVMARNRRMFGALLGTLQSFQKDSKKEVDKEKRRAEVERKLEEKQRDEEFQLRRDKAALWNERREKQRELRQLEAKMKLVHSFEEWEKIVRDEANFIRTTKGRHQIYYMPKVLLPANNRALEDTEDYIDAMVESRKKKLQEEIERIMSSPLKRRQQRPSSDQQAHRGEGSVKSEDSDSSEQSAGSDLEEGEVVSRRRHNLSESDRHVVNVKKEVEVKQEVVERNEAFEASGQVSNSVGDEVQMESEDEDSRPAGRADDDDVDEFEAMRRKRRAMRSRSSSSRSRSPTPVRRPTRAKSGKKKSHNESNSASDSGSSRGSGSSSSSDSEPERQGKSTSNARRRS